MSTRFVSIWFRQLKTDWLIRRQPSLKQVPFVLVLPDHGRMIITAANEPAKKQGVYMGMVLADAMAIITELQFFDDEPSRAALLLTGLAEWCIRYTPAVARDLPDGLLLNVSGCAHLWGGEEQYLGDITKRLHYIGYHISIAIADTIGAAWAMARFGKEINIVEPSQQTDALLSLPPPALRLEAPVIERLEKLGLRQIHQFIAMPRPALRRRFGQGLLSQLDKALGLEEETIQPIQPIVAYQERLPCLEPIVTATGIEIALQRLLDAICKRLQQEEKGLRLAILKCCRVDGKMQSVDIGTLRPSCNSRHLFKLFEEKIATIEPALGIELFILEAPSTEDHSPVQKKLFDHNGGLDDMDLAELLDRIAGKTGAEHIHRYMPDEHYWPERSYKPAVLNETVATEWKFSKPRPLQVLPTPQPIEVTAPVPDYPPMNFRYMGTLHTIVKADGPERIEQEWWLQQGRHRDYYAVEDEAGQRYWLFRSGHYDVRKTYKWFLHGFFA
jgi:protein ImuB